MNTSTTLQVPLPKTLKASATVAARQQGFSSLQDLVRLMLTKLVRREITVRISEVPIKLSARAAKQYAQMDKDFKTEKNIHTASSMKELMKDLTSQPRGT